MSTPVRWQATVAAALCMAVGVSAVFMGSFPIFLRPISTELGWGRATFPQIITVMSLVAALLMPVAGGLVVRFGVHRPVAFGLVFAAMGMILLSFLHGKDGFFWLAALCLGAASAIAGPPAYIGLISTWYDRNRALAIGCILSVAPACSQALVAPATQLLVNAFGWRISYRILALVVLMVGLIASLSFLRPRASIQEDRGPVSAAGANAFKALRTPVFWLLAIASCLANGTVIGLQVHLVAWLTGRAVPAATAAFVISTLFLGGVAGAFVAGFVADRTRRIRVLQIFYAFPLIGLLAMGASTYLPFLLAGALLIGIGGSAVTGLAPYLVTRYFGVKASAEIFGVQLGMTLLTIGIVPVLIGLGYDLTGSYTIPMIFAGVSVAIATVCIGLADRVSGGGLRAAKIESDATAGADL